jgi:hypothetical protein
LLINLTLLIFLIKIFEIKKEEKMEWKWEKEMLRMLLYAKKEKIDITENDLNSITILGSMRPQEFTLENDPQQKIWFSNIKIKIPCPRSTIIAIEGGMESAITFFKKITL